MRRLAGRLRYAVEVELVGAAVLALRRRRAQRRGGVPRNWRSDLLAPPLRCSPLLKELISRYYLEGAHARLWRKVAWVTSGAPVELLKALDFYVFYPEPHAALCGAARQAVEIAEAAEAAGYSRDICSYARTDLGALFSGRTPVGRIPRPDLIVACTNICQTVLAWYRVIAHELDVPLVLVDTPFLSGDAPPHAVEYVKKQVEETIPLLERVAGKTLAPRRLEAVTVRSRDACTLWLEIMRRNRHEPAPCSVFDLFIHMAPIVEMRGDERTIRYYEILLRELDQRIAAGVGAVKGERRRLLWDNLPIWYRLRRLAEFLAERGIAIVASTYTNAWGELAPMIDPRKPLDSLARTYLHPILNCGAGHKLETIRRMIAEYGIHGVILHSDRSCKPYSIGQMDQRDRLLRSHEIPALLLEADHNDPRAYAEEPTFNRLAAFCEMLE
jgi:benzoyl-CoA reductase/2-hydroxyglutaryl-CoA dehydratase subunit BcrC/BadD/HgdB